MNCNANFSIPNKPSYRTLLNSSKNPKLWTCLARNMPNLGLNPEKNELQTLLNPGSSTKIKLRTHLNPSKIPNYKPTNLIWPNTNTISCTQSFREKQDAFCYTELFLFEKANGGNLQLQIHAWQHASGKCRKSLWKSGNE